MLANGSRRMLYLIFILVSSIWSRSLGVTLPPFRQLAHDIQSGAILILNNTSIHIEEFYYDGKSLDAYFWVGKGLPSSNGTKIPDENGSLKPLSTYTGKNITLHLPANLTIFDIDYLAIWNDVSKHNFGHVFMNERFIHTNRTRMFLPLRIKPFDSALVKSDSVVIKDEQSIEISNIQYQPHGNNVTFRIGNGTPSENSEIVPNEYGSVQNILHYDGQNITLTLPKNFSVSENDYLSVWDNNMKEDLGSVYFNRIAISEKQSANIIGIQLDSLRNDTHDLYSGPILLIDEKTFYISNFHQKHRTAEFRISLKNSMSMQIPNEFGSYLSLDEYQGESFYLNLPGNIIVKDVEKLGVWNNVKEEYLAYIVLNITTEISPYRPHPDVTDDGKRIIRVPKCCPYNHVVADDGCVQKDVDFDIDMKLHLANETHLNDDPMIREWIVFAPYINNINCPKYYLTPEMDNYSLLTTGKLLYISAKEQLSLDKYCMDNIYHRNDNSREGKYINTVFVCAEGDSGPQTMHVVFAVCAFLSSLALFLAGSIYFMIRQPHDKRDFNIAGYGISMGVAFVCLAVTQIAGLETVCKILGIIFHLCIVMSFVWFVVIAYEVYFHIKYYYKDNLVLGYPRRRLIYFCISVCVPLVFVGLALIFNVPAGLLNTHLDAVCLFDNQKWMLYVPIIVSIFLANVLTGLSCYLFRKTQNLVNATRNNATNGSPWSQQNSNNPGWQHQISMDETTKASIWRQQKSDIQDRKRFCLFLVALTSVCWLCEIVTFSLRFPIYVLDVIHALQGVMVLTTVLSTGGVVKKIRKFFNNVGTRTPKGDLEMERLNYS